MGGWLYYLRMRNNFLKKIVFITFLAVILSLIISTFFPLELAEKLFYRTSWFSALWLILALVLIGCMFSFFKEKRYSFALVCMGLLLIISAGLSSGFLVQEGFIEIKEGETVNGFWIDDNSFQSLNFSISLKDFSVEFYPHTNSSGYEAAREIGVGVKPGQRKGMSFIKSYKSSIGISRKKNLLKEGTIEVNKPLSFEGFNFYQYGYDERFPGQTVLQVVKDPGLVFIYAGYFILLTGMVFSFKRIFFSV